MTSIWKKAFRKGNSKHQKLSEDWSLTKEPVLDGVTFYVKYLGSTLVETSSGEEETAEAIKTVITMAKASGKKLPRVSLTVSLRGITMTDMSTTEIQLEVSIYRISYCSADATYDHVFAFIATNTNETNECHAFLCPKRKMSQAVTLTIAQSFNMAYEVWKLAQHRHDVVPQEEEEEDSENEPDTVLDKKSSTARLIDFSSQDGDTENMQHHDKTWVCFEDDNLENLNNSFASLAASQAQKHSFTNSPKRRLTELDLNIWSTSQQMSGFDNSDNSTTWKQKSEICLLQDLL